jgi:hypothetical protein
MVPLLDFLRQQAQSSQSSKILGKFEKWLNFTCNENYMMQWKFTNISIPDIQGQTHTGKYQEYIYTDILFHFEFTS